MPLVEGLPDGKGGKRRLELDRAFLPAFQRRRDRLNRRQRGWRRAQDVARLRSLWDERRSRLQPETHLHHLKAMAEWKSVTVAA